MQGQANASRRRVSAQPRHTARHTVSRGLTRPASGAGVIQQRRYRDEMEEGRLTLYTRETLFYPLFNPSLNCG